MASKGALVKGEVINGTYEVLFYIAEGAFGEVYRVQHKYLGVQIFKLLKEDFQESANIEEIAREARILAQVTHPNIVRIFEANSFLHKGRTRQFLTMGFISGETLTQLMSRRMVLPRLEAVKIMMDVLKGLAHVHNLIPPVIHRDINPDNILLSYEGSTPVGLLSDFGLAQALDASEHLPNAAGRYPYMAPECFWGNYLLTSDVFSAGVVLYRAVTGLYPWQYELEWVDTDPEDVVTEIIRARKMKPRPPSFYLVSDDLALDTVILTAIERDLDNRYKTADMFLSALKGWYEYADKEAKIKATSSPIPTTASASEEHSTESPISREFSAKKKGKGLDRVAGMHDLKETLFQDIIRPLMDVRLYAEYGVSPPNGMLLFGPPGCGKTYIARQLAEEVGYHFIEVKPSTLASTLVHGTQKKISELFEEACQKAPTLIFIDEVDAVLPSREGRIDQHLAGEVNEFLAQMTDCSERNIFVVAATNRPEKLDSAILRTGRIDKVVYLGPPDVFAREEMLRLHLGERPVAFDFDFTELARLTNAYVSSDIKFLVNEASRLALVGRQKIDLQHFKTVIEKNHPSVSKEQIRTYEKFSRQRTFF
jgi:transitional endoplasmic reticulum ATPase